MEASNLEKSYEEPARTSSAKSTYTPSQEYSVSILRLT